LFLKIVRAQRSSDERMTRFEIVDRLTERNNIDSPVFETNDEEVALTKLTKIRQENKSLANYVLIDLWRNRQIVA
jgi:hypothetical protein